MAWRPTLYLIEGELDNTQPGQVSGWLQFVRMKNKVILRLAGDFHRDIRGTRVLLAGVANPGYVGCMRGFSRQQTGKVGDMTAGLPPRDYVHRPYFEWYSQENGRVLLAPDLHQLRFCGRPLPADACEPISRQEQEGNYAEFLREAARHTRMAAVVMAMAPHVPSDPTFSHWVIADGRIAGEARCVQLEANGCSAACIRLFDRPDSVQYDHIETAKLRGKNVAAWIA
jgi:hypothetical protein